MSTDQRGLPPATGAWREGDPVAWRQFVDIGGLDLELGGSLPQVRVAFETYGRPTESRDNAVLVLHALTGDAHVSGPGGPGQPTAGWWPGIAEAGGALDPATWFVVSANVLGGCQGTTGPASLAPDGEPWGSRWPRITVRDQVEVERRLADALGIDRFAAVIGGSMGGMRALEWAISYPDRVGSALVLASCAAATADQIGTQTSQILAITSDPNWRGGDYYGAEAGAGPHRGMGLARRFAHLTYRTESELELRFGRDPQAGSDPLTSHVVGRDTAAGEFSVQSYLDHHANKLAGRFDAGTYVALSDAMNTHDVGRGRGGIAAALGSITVPVVVGGIESDRLYPIRLQQELARLIPTCAECTVIPSPYGHDGFLLEHDAVSALVRRTLEKSSAHGRSTPSTIGA